MSASTATAANLGYSRQEQINPSNTPQYPNGNDKSSLRGDCGPNIESDSRTQPKMDGLGIKRRHAVDAEQAAASMANSKEINKFHNFAALTIGSLIVATWVLVLFIIF